MVIAGLQLNYGVRQMNGRWVIRMRIVTGILAVWIVSACTEWHVIPRTAGGFYPADRLPRAKIRLINGTSTDLSDTRIREDSVVGTDPASRARVAFSIRDVSQIESEEYSRSRTLLLGSAIAAAFLGIDLYGVAHQ